MDTSKIRLDEPRRRKINTDGIDQATLNDSDQLITYEGCGCAGGLVTTIQSELVPRDDQPTVNARRTQKVFQDIQGRTWKTEVMGWDGTTPYTTTVQTFNGRDQAVRTRQYAGTTSSSTYQDVSMTFDGHGRMKTRHYPVEDAATNTTWIYNPDDSIQQIIDPRGAITNFTYNSRGLTEQISYDPPSSTPPHVTIPDTPNVSFVYDALGNRTSMQDGSGTHTYAYDELSRITSETKDFTDLSNTLTIGYTYHLSGGLKSITDPFSSAVNYTNDKTGRLTSVAGTPYAQNTTGSYASNIKYRAFGQIKQMDYTLPNDTQQIKMEYDNRLRVNHHEMTTSLKPSGYLMKADFSYLADSRTAGKDDLLDNKWDRSMKYDQAGRFAFNQFGLEFGTTGDRVYQQTVSYDAFSQMTSRIGMHWGNEIEFGATYSNGRKTNGLEIYDASGNIVDVTENVNSFQRWQHDAAGRRTITLTRTIANPGGQGGFVVLESQYENVFDGDGRPVVERNGSRNVAQTPVPPMVVTPKKFEVWSTVLGAALTDVNPDGTKMETKVFAGAAPIARQSRYVDVQQQVIETIGWTGADPVTGTSGGTSYQSGTQYLTVQDYEPFGQSIQSENPNQYPEQGPQVGSAGEPEWQCQLPMEWQPYHCKIKADIANSINGTSIKQVYDPNKKPGDPNFIHIDDPPKEKNEDADDRLRNETLRKTDKPVLKEYGGKRIAPTSVPSASGDEDEDDDVDYETNTVTVRGGPSLPVDFQGAEVGTTAGDPTYQKCKGLAIEISLAAYQIIRDAVATDRDLDPGLIAATWIHEGGFDNGVTRTQNIENNLNIKNGLRRPGNYDAGPMQVNHETWTNYRNADVMKAFDGLDNHGLSVTPESVFGTEGKYFDGSPVNNVIFAGRILSIYARRYGSRTDAAAYYTTGEGKNKKNTQAFKDRANSVGHYLPAFDSFFRCMGL